MESQPTSWAMWAWTQPFGDSASSSKMTAAVELTSQGCHECDVHGSMVPQHMMAIFSPQQPSSNEVEETGTDCVTSGRLAWENGWLHKVDLCHGGIVNLLTTELFL